MELHGLRQPNSDLEPMDKIMGIKKIYFEVLVGIFILGSPKHNKGCFTKRMPYSMTNVCVQRCNYNYLINLHRIRNKMYQRDEYISNNAREDSF